MYITVHSIFYEKRTQKTSGSVIDRHTEIEISPVYASLLCETTKDAISTLV